MYIKSSGKITQLMVVGDRVLIKPDGENDRTPSGLLLPPGVIENEKVAKGTVVKTGPGHLLPLPIDNEPWKMKEDQVTYLPLQVEEGDTVLYLHQNAVEIKYEGEKYCIVQHSSILLIERDTVD